MRPGAACLPALLACAGHALAATAYVSDDLILGVYAQQNQGGERLATLHSGATVETLASSGDYTQVRTADGTTGWVKSSFLVSHEPAAARVKELEDELNRSHATEPALAEAAAQSEAARLKEALAASRAELAALRASLPAGSRRRALRRRAAAREWSWQSWRAKPGVMRRPLSWRLGWDSGGAMPRSRGASGKNLVESRCIEPRPPASVAKPWADFDIWVFAETGMRHRHTTYVTAGRGAAQERKLSRGAGRLKGLDFFDAIRPP